MQLVQCVLIKHLCKTEVARVMKYSKSQTSFLQKALFIFGFMVCYSSITKDICIFTRTHKKCDYKTTKHPDRD